MSEPTPEGVLQTAVRAAQLLREATSASNAHLVLASGGMLAMADWGPLSGTGVEVRAISPETHRRGREEWPEYSPMLLPVGVHVFARIAEDRLVDGSLVSTARASVPGWNPGVRGAYYRARQPDVESAVAFLIEHATPPEEVR